MLTHIQIQFGLSRLIRGTARMFVVTSAVALAIICSVIGFEVTTVNAGSDDEVAGQVLNRMRKSDRLPAVPAFRPNTTNQAFEVKVPHVRSHDPKLAEGCEPLVSFLASSRLSRIAGRCVT